MRGALGPWNTGRADCLEENSFLLNMLPKVDKTETKIMASPYLLSPLFHQFFPLAKNFPVPADTTKTYISLRSRGNQEKGR